MIIHELLPDNMAETILNVAENTNDDFFVFPTDIVMNSWTDWIVTHSKKQAVALERFTAWDNFKSDFISDHQAAGPDSPKKTVVPSILRKMFLTDLIAKNACLDVNDDEKFHEIVNPDYAEEAAFNADWLCDTLRSLHFWKKRFDDYVEKNPQGETDWEDRDYNLLYKKYKDFLDSNNLFEPSWVEDIKFTEKNKFFHIFYPELLEDFSDYKELFEKVPNIHIYVLPKNNSKSSESAESSDSGNSGCSAPDVYLYPDSRKELRQTMLSIVNIVQRDKDSGKNTDWSEIALSVPDIETYRPYIQREFDLYGIPYVIKAGISMTKNAAGRVFREIKDCYDSNFSYDSLRTLLLDEYMPWKDQLNDKKEALIKEGNRMRCICSVTGDVWIKAFQQKIENLNVKLEKYKELALKDISFEEKITETENNLAYFTETEAFYNVVKDGVSKFFAVESFENILTSWMEFKKTFFDEENFTEDENNILSRCIVELKEIMDIEKEYPGLVNPSPYNFFLQELDKKTYTPQTDKTGVNIFPYRLSAAAYFKYQFVIDCSQRNIDVSYKRLTYLSDKKRDALLTEEEKLNNTSDVFIKLYGKKSQAAGDEIVHFSAATDSFSGFAIPHNCLNILDEENNPNFDEQDYILKEREIIKSPDSFSPGEKFLQSQIDSYNSWKNTAIENDCHEYKINKNIENAIKTRLKTEEYGKPVISARGTLENFFPCPRKWILGKALNVKEENQDTNLMKTFDMGLLNHKILQLFMNKYFHKILPFYDEEDEVFKYSNKNHNCSCENEINSYLFGENNIVEEAIIHSGIKDFEDSPLAITSALSQKEKIAIKIKDFLKFLLLPYGKSKATRVDWISINGIGGCKVMGTEFSPKNYDFDNFAFSGQVDAYFKNPNGDLIIIDYKNSQSAVPGEKEIYVNKDKILKDFQMPLYYKLISNNNKDSKIYACYFYAIKDDKVKRKFIDGISIKAAVEKYRKNLFDDAGKKITSLSKKISSHEGKVRNAREAFEKNEEKVKKCQQELELAKTDKKKSSAVEKLEKACVAKEKKEKELETAIKELELINEDFNKYKNIRSSNSDENAEIKEYEALQQKEPVAVKAALDAIDEYGKLFINTVKNNDFMPYHSEDFSDIPKIRRSVKNYEDCKDCPYKNICRTTYVIAGKTLSER